MSLVPVGNRQVMKQQEVRGVFSTDLRPLLKLAIAPMPQQPPKQVATEDVQLGQGGSSPEQPEQPDQSQQPGQQNGQRPNPQQDQGVGGSFMQPGALEQKTDQQTQEEEVEQQKAEYKRILELESQLVKRLKAKNLNTKIKVDTSPKQMRITFDTSHYIVDEADGQPKAAEEALGDVISWWKVELGGNATYEIFGGTEGRAIGKVDPKERVQFTFGYTPQAQKNKQEEQITTMNSKGGNADAGQSERPNSRMGMPPKHEEVMAHTLREWTNLHKQALVNKLSKIAGLGAK